MPELSPYNAICDPNRRQILDLLRNEGPLRAGDIVAHISTISQPAVSKHLRVLREAQLVHVVQEGRARIYHLRPEALRPIAEWLVHYETVWDERLDTLKHLVEQNAQR